MIKKIKNQLEEIYYDFKNRKKYLGLEVKTRPYKKIPLIISIILITLGFLFFYLPVINPITMSLVSIKLLNWVG